MYAQFYAERGSGDSNSIVAISAVKQDGTEVDENSVPMITDRNWGMSTPYFQGVVSKDVTSFHVWRRRRQWVTFSGFASEPVNPPREHVTSAEVAAALDAQGTPR
jgi:hypothetical protein